MNEVKKILTLLLVFMNITYLQTFRVAGVISTSTEPVQNALVTFVDESDTSNRFSALTDTLGRYQVDIITSVKPAKKLPTNFELEQNYPNPFSSSTAISYKLNKQSDVYVIIYDILGREVRRFTVGMQTAGVHGILWDGRNNFGKKVATGVYLYRLQVGKESLVKKMVYGVSESSDFDMPIKTIVSHKLEKEVSASFQEVNYIVKIKNTASTKPKIAEAVYPNVMFYQDTTINFAVQKSIMEYSLCYQRQDSIENNGEYPYVVWAQHLTNLAGTKNKTIISEPGDADYSSWSPDGKYIAFRHKKDIHIYDTDDDTILRLTNSRNVNSGPQLWTHNSKKIIYERWVIGTGAVPYIIDIDGTHDKKLKVNPFVNNVGLLFKDNYTCLFEDGTKLYKSNLDSTFSEFIVDIEHYTIRDFNPNTEELLINTSGESSSIIEFNVNTKQKEIILTAEEGYDLGLQRYSKDYSKIVFSERGYGEGEILENYLTVYENGIKTRLLKFTGGTANEWLDYRPFQFSPDGKYVAFSINVTQEGPWFWWISYLHVIDIKTKELYYVDVGIDPQWNPVLLH